MNPRRLTWCRGLTAQSRTVPEKITHQFRYKAAEAEYSDKGEQAQLQEATTHKVRLVITPDAFISEPAESWDDWLGHFESVARVNGWDENCD